MCSQSNELAVGLDIGTTTISATILDLTTKRQVDFFHRPNSFSLPRSAPHCAEQDADGIAAKTTELLDHIIGSYPHVRAIGITGQMHGIVYIDHAGNAVSPLVTWQDKRGDCMIEPGITYCDRICALTGERIATGYGFATHIYHVHNGLVPVGAASFCTIMDYVAMRLTGRTAPLIHSSNAASFGMFDTAQMRFKQDKLALLPLGGITLPEVTDDFSLCGDYRGIPVAVGIGDNQASFLGSVKDLDDTILVNIGTGSQISMVSDSCTVGDTLELRPLIKGKYLICGSALCGGSAYALLERFFRAYLVSSGAQDHSQYAIINRLAAEAYAQKAAPPKVHTTFCGTRNAPQQKGAILEIDTQNFTPGHLALGFVFGICEELHSLFLDAGEHHKTLVVASGGAVQRIPVMKHAIADTFGMPVCLSVNEEEAAIGTALFASAAAGLLRGSADFADFLQYAPEQEEA